MGWRAECAIRQDLPGHRSFSRRAVQPESGTGDHVCRGSDGHGRHGVAHTRRVSKRPELQIARRPYESTDTDTSIWCSRTCSDQSASDRAHGGEKTLHSGGAAPMAFQCARARWPWSPRVLHGEGLAASPEGDPLFREVQRDPALLPNRFEIRQEALRTIRSRGRRETHDACTRAASPSAVTLTDTRRLHSCNSLRRSITQLDRDRLVHRGKLLHFASRSCGIAVCGVTTLSRAPGGSSGGH